MATRERRKDSRMGLTLPVRVQGHTEGAAWEEMTTSDDTSYGGTAFVVTHAVQPGHCLHLDMPLPKSFRRYALSDATYHTYALVRDVRPVEKGYRIGVMFLGKNPPKGYEQNPGHRYLLPTDPKPAPKERRQFRRLDIFANFKLSRTAGDGHGPREERTVAENVGKGGARVLTSLAVTKGEVLLVEEMGGDFRTRAEIKNVYIGKDNIPRLNLAFLDAQAPERLVSG